MRLVVAYICLFCFIFSFSACAWIGEGAGKAQASVEKGVHSLKKGYKEGYEEVKSGEK